MRCPCALFVSSRSGVVLYENAGAITDPNQSAKEIDPHFKSLLCEGHRSTKSTRKACINFTEWAE